MALNATISMIGECGKIKKSNRVVAMEDRGRYYYIKRISSFVFFYVLLLTCNLCSASELENLKVNRMLVPQGIVRTGQFSWQISSEVNNIRQKAYHIKVASTLEGLKGGPTLMWDSGKRESEDMVQVFYQGRRFPYESIIYWQLEVWLSNEEHLQSPIQKIETGSKSSMWNEPSITNNQKHDYQYYLRWLNILQINQSDYGDLFWPVSDDTLAIPVDRAVAVLYSLYKDEGDVKAVYDYYNMVSRWLRNRCEKDSTVSSQLLDMMTEMAQCINMQADVRVYSNLQRDSTAYEPFWLYDNEPAWCAGAITQIPSSIAYNRVEITIPTIERCNKDSVIHECPYGTIYSEWSRDENKIISWEVHIPVGVQAKLIYPRGYADNEGDRSQIIGSGNWVMQLLPEVEEIDSEK